MAAIRFLQVLCNALWYVTNQHVAFESASKHLSDVFAVPSLFDSFQGYNDIKRKRTKEMPMTAEQLRSHSEALYSLCLKPIMKSTEAWNDAYLQLKALADCLAGYKTYLVEQATNQSKIRKLDHPVRTVSEHCTVEHRCKAILGVKDKFRILDACVCSDESQPVFFSEEKHLLNAFENNMQRLRYFEELKLSVPIDIYIDIVQGVPMLL